MKKQNATMSNIVNRIQINAKLLFNDSQLVKNLVYFVEFFDYNGFNYHIDFKPDSKIVLYLLV